MAIGGVLEKIMAFATVQAWNSITEMKFTLSGSETRGEGEKKTMYVSR